MEAKEERKQVEREDRQEGTRLALQNQQRTNDYGLSHARRNGLFRSPHQNCYLFKKF